jgi:hypothetical protein
MNAAQGLALATVVVLAGCASTTAVQLASAGKSGFDGAVFSGQSADLEAPVPGVEQFRVFQQGATGFVSVQNVRSGVEEIATNFCTRKHKAMHAVSETVSTPPHMLGNYPRVELVFQCVDRPDAQPSQGNASKYDKIAALKKLLDGGALTQQEFDAEKAKLLSTP